MVMYLLRRLILIFLLLISCKFAYGEDSAKNSSSVGDVSASRSMLDWSKTCLRHLQEFDRSVSYGGRMEGAAAAEAQRQIAGFIKSKQFKMGEGQNLATFVEAFLSRQAHAMQKQRWLRLADGSKNKPGDDFFDSSLLVGEELGEYEYPFIQKHVLPRNSKICFMGDFHGSVHSLLRNLWRLVALGYLDENFRIVKNDFYMVFLGDYTDRGGYGLEVLYTVLRLKLQNWDRVMLTRGNHEDERMNSEKREGFIFADLAGKGLYTLYPTIKRAYTLLPLANIIHIQGAKKDIFCAHGGFEYRIDLSRLQSSPSNKCMLLSSRDKYYKGYAWSDIVQDHESTPNGYNGWVLESKSRGGGTLNYDAQYLQSYMRNNGFAALLRGHQDMGYGCKMLYLPGQIPENIFERSDAIEKMLGLNFFCPKRADGSRYEWFIDFVFKRLGYNYIKGPFHWRNVVSMREQRASKGFQLKNYLPVFTLSSAPQGRGIAGNAFPFDCFTILDTSAESTALNPSDQWRMQVVESVVNPLRNGMYCLINRARKPSEKNPANMIVESHSVEKPENPIGAELLKMPVEARARRKRADEELKGLMWQQIKQFEKSQDLE